MAKKGQGGGRKAGDRPNPELSAVGAAGTEKPAGALTDEQMQALLHIHVGQIAPQMQKIATATSDLRNLYKTAKADGFSKRDIDDALAARKDGAVEKIKAQMERTAKISRWMGAPLGTQADLFGGSDDTPSEERAFDAGKVAGLAAEQCKPPHAPSTPQFKRWMDGYHAGQEVRIAELGKMKQPEEMARIVPAPKARSAATAASASVEGDSVVVPLKAPVTGMPGSIKPPMAPEASAPL